MALYAGLISGTSMDGVESVLLDITPAGHQVRAALHLDYPPELGHRLRQAVADPASCNLDDYGQLDAAVGAVFAECAARLLENSGVNRRCGARHRQPRPDRAAPAAWHAALHAADR
ncbi:MAG: anhydro-N-acetylmuramic acid kinase [Steroidobacteraceae bacterium]